MQAEILIGKTPYSIEVLDESKLHTAYMLRSMKGPTKELALLRNVPNPKMLFAVRFPGIKPTRLWFTDRDGDLKLVSY